MNKKRLEIYKRFEAIYGAEHFLTKEFARLVAQPEKTPTSILEMLCQAHEQFPMRPRTEEEGTLLVEKGTIKDEKNN